MMMHNNNDNITTAGHWDLAKNYSVWLTAYRWYGNVCL